MGKYAILCASGGTWKVICAVQHNTPHNRKVSHVVLQTIRKKNLVIKARKNFLSLLFVRKRFTIYKPRLINFMTFKFAAKNCMHN
jgi:hypothetical protein